jgi:hypothetical protein
MKPRYLTKSRFKLALDCETKLFYSGKKEYANAKMDDPFLKALAEGGFQVGELAKCYYPGGHDIESLDYEEAEKQTQELLKQDNVIIFEPAIRYKNLFIRIDILVKNGNSFKLIEVKAKSFDSNHEDQFFKKNGKDLLASWKPYLYDVAFQKHVLQKAYPNSIITSSLMLADKNAVCQVDGLNQKFRIVRDESNRTGVKVSQSLTDDDLKDKVLVNINVDEAVNAIHASNDGSSESFEDMVSRLASNYESDKRLESSIGSKCKGCEFQNKSDDGKLKDGFKECWSKALDWKDHDFEESNVLEIWNFRKKDKLIASGVVKVSGLIEEDVSPTDDKKPGLSASQRQWMQIEKARDKDDKPYFDAKGLADEMRSWVYPLHFIDFETTAMAIPFNKGRRPYEGLAFQFSHHVVHEDGRTEHAGQYLNTNTGEFPSYNFLRALKAELENDEGFIFCYSQHENTYLNLIYRQLQEETSEIPDKDELCAFIRSITHSKKESVDKWEGSRDMVDMWRLVKRYYYDPKTKGSNSIKAVLPAILNSSAELQEKYSKAIYGSKAGIKSLNFKNWKWIQKKGDQVEDPYKLLPKMFEDASEKDLKLLSIDDEVNNGGAALTAYARMQFTEMSKYERAELEQALLKYCELDTFAMVMIYEGWLAMLAGGVGVEAA